MDKTEEIIILVERNPILYDKSESNYKDTTKRQELWKELGQKVGLTGKEVESRWRTVRDNYARYRKKLTSRPTTTSGDADAASTLKEYKYARVLSFLIPHFVERPTSSDLVEEEVPVHDDQLLSSGDDDASQAQNSQATTSSTGTSTSTSTKTSSIASSSSSSNSKRKRKRSPSDVDAMLLEYLKKSTTGAVNVDKPDDVDLFLQSMASSIRKLPAHKRSVVKFKIHSIVYEAEMQCSV